MAFDATPPEQPPAPPPMPRPRRASRTAHVVVIALPIAAAVGIAALFKPSVAFGGDPDLLRLLKALAYVKAALVAGAVAAVLVRLKTAITARRLVLYSATLASAGLGIGLLSVPTQLLAGAIALHTGLVGTMVQLFRDPGMHRSLMQLSRASRHVIHGS